MYEPQNIQNMHTTKARFKFKLHTETGKLRSIPDEGAGSIDLAHNRFLGAAGKGNLMNTVRGEKTD